jgi:hypothetical protein
VHRRPHPATLIDSNIRPDSLDKILFLLTTSPARSTRKMRISRARPPYVNWNAFFLKQSFRRQQSEWAKGDGAFLISRTAIVHSNPPSALEIRRRNRSRAAVSEVRTVSNDEGMSTKREISMRCAMPERYFVLVRRSNSLNQC